MSEGPDYQALWKKLEAELLATQHNTATSVCVENDNDKSRILRGAWGAYGQIYNAMQRLLSEALGLPPTES